MFSSIDGVSMERTFDTDAKYQRFLNATLLLFTVAQTDSCFLMSMALGSGFDPFMGLCQLLC